MNEKLRLKLKKISPACVVADHLFGTEHTIKHKMISGSFLMILGVIISKATPQLALFHYLTDGIGYLIHGMGAIPFGEYLAGTQTTNTEENESKT